MSSALRPEPSQVEIVAVWHVTPSALMVLGRSSGPMPKTGSARLANAPGALGVFRLDFWALESGHAFFAAICLPEHAGPVDGSELLIRGARVSDRDLPMRLPQGVSEAEFARLLAKMAQHNTAAIIRFLIDLLRPEDRDVSGLCENLFEYFLEQTAKSDGCIELILAIPGHCVVLQGWGVPPTEPLEILTTRPAPARLALQVGRFDRDDIPKPATGNIFVLPAEALTSVTESKAIYLLSGNDLLCRNVIDSKPLTPETSIGQLRHLLPRLHCSTPLQFLLRSALQPRFDGRDTLNNAGRPVRAALDQAVAAKGAGIYISGWLFDPTGQVTTVEICTDDGLARLDDQFVRIPRPDVSEAFRAESKLSSVPKHDWGFAVQTSTPAGSDIAHLRFTFADDELAFMPVRFTDAATLAGRQALLDSVDVHKPSGIAVVEQHVAPFLARVPTPPTVARTILTGPLSRPHAIVVPLVTVAPPRVLISNLLHDPVDPDEQLVLVCGGTWDQTSLFRLIELVRFYDLPASVLLTDDLSGASSALLSAALLSKAEDFLLLSPDAASPHSGWRRFLRRRAIGHDVACPTLLYEDRATRFAGSSKAKGLERPPYVKISVAQAGMPATTVSSDQVLPMTGGTFACALLNRVALSTLASSTRFCTGTMQEAAAFAALANAGLKLAWVPTLQVIAPDGGDATGVVARLVDGWLYRATFEEDRACAS